MDAVVAVVTGGLYGAGFYMLLRRSVIRLVIGLVLLGQAANLLIFTGAGLVRAAPPLVPAGAERSLEAAADPLAQALVLTAIVINFGMTAFALVLAARAERTIGTDNVDLLTRPEA